MPPGIEWRLAKSTSKVFFDIIDSTRKILENAAGRTEQKVELGPPLLENERPELDSAATGADQKGNLEKRGRASETKVLQLSSIRFAGG